MSMCRFEVLAAVAAMAMTCFGYDHVFVVSEGTKKYQGYRSFEYGVPEDGLYAVYVEYGKDNGNQAIIPYLTRVWMDDRQLMFLQSKDGCRGRLDRRQRLRAVRHLTKGLHRFDFYVHWSAYLWEDEMDMANGKVVFAIERLRGDMGQDAVGFWMDETDGRVFDVGRQVAVAAANASKSSQLFTLVILTPEGREEEKNFDLPSGEHCRMPLPTTREGEWRWSVKDRDGRMLEGPWEYAVVARTPTEGFHQDDGANDDVSVIVDRVDCTEAASGPHSFRERGESAIVETENGAYRRTGDTGLAQVEYAFVKRTRQGRGVGLRPVRGGEKADRTFRSCDWFAYTLKVKHPGKAHILRCQIPNDHHHLTTVVAHDRKTRLYNGFGMLAGNAPASGPWSDLEIFLWPNSEVVDVMVINSIGNHGSRFDRRGCVKSMELVEYPKGLPRLEMPVHGWNKTREFGMRGEQVDLGINERTWPDLSADRKPGAPYSNARTWKHFLQAWDRFGQIAAWRGDNLCVYPIHTYGMVEFQAPVVRLLPPGADKFCDRRFVQHDKCLDDVDRDIFMLMLKESSKYGVRMMADFMIQRVGSEICKCWADDAGVSTNGMLLSWTADGKPCRSFSNATFPNPAHPAVRKVYCDFVRGMAERYGHERGFAGICNRFWSGWPGSFESWFFDFNTGYDDFTVAEFSKATGIGLAAVGSDPDKFAARKEQLKTHYRREWMKWRGDVVISLREEMLAAMRSVNPDLKFLNDYEPSRYRADSPGSGIDDPRLDNRRELGMVRHRVNIGVGGNEYGCEINDLDPACFRAFDLREDGERIEPLETFSARNVDFPQGACCDGTVRPYPYNLESAARALAENKLELLMTTGSWTLPAADRELRKWVRAYRAIPDIKWTEFPMEGDKSSPVAIWYGYVKGDDSRKRLVFFAVNRSDLERKLHIRFDTSPKFIEDYVNGSENKGFCFSPFAIKVIAVDGVARIVSASVELDARELAEARAGFDFLTCIRPAASKCEREVCVGGGEEYLAGLNELGRYDVSWSFDGLYKPIMEAMKAGEDHRFVSLMHDFRSHHRVWYERCGWPKEFCVPRTIGRGALASHLSSKYEYTVWPSTNTATRVMKEFSDERMTVVPRGEAIGIYVHGSPRGRCIVGLEAVFGGGYGDIVVEMDNKEVGRFRDLGFASPRLETRVLGWSLKSNHKHGTKVTLRGTGPKGMAIKSFGYDSRAPKSVTQFSVCGPFDKKGGTGDAESYKKLFPPDEGVDFSAKYVGINGKEIGWRQIDIGKRKVVDMTEITPYDIINENGVSYLVAYIKSPGQRAVELLYSNDYFGSITVNGDIVVPRMTGPLRSYRGAYVLLRRGWNEIRIKTSCGSAQKWYFALAVDDPGDFEYSAVGPNKLNEEY